ncbi:MAG: hypothetical protein ACQEQX_08015, partial [Thermodesulfobacteriota bacterium]
MLIIVKIIETKFPSLDREGTGEGGHGTNFLILTCKILTCKAKGNLRANNNNQGLRSAYERYKYEPKQH